MTVWLDAKQVAESLGITLASLQRMARRREFPELLHVSRGVYRVRRTDYEAWESGRMTSAEQARAELAAERMRAAVASSRSF